MAEIVEGWAWHLWPATNRQQQQPGLGLYWRRKEVAICYLKPQNVLLVCQLVSMGTRAKRVEPDEAVWLWETCWANCTTGWQNPAAQVAGDTAMGIAVAHPQNKNSPASSEVGGLYEALDPLGIWRDLLYSQSPLEGERAFSVL